MELIFVFFSGLDYQINSFGKSEYEIDDYWSSEENVTDYSPGKTCRV